MREGKRGKISTFTNRDKRRTEREGREEGREGGRKEGAKGEKHGRSCACILRRK